jgi:4-amino-4-deoxy-L-arabinose transferase-like glycosyltransferase
VSAPGSSSSPRARRLAFLAAVSLVLVFFAAPLFVGLDRADMANDESIYSYAVQRILETGDWLNPRYIPTDFLFVEKPPLKFWLVAGAMKAGLLPETDAGMRTIDAAFGGLVFVYVFLLGVELAGPVCGLAAGLLLFVFQPLLFVHGLRSNNMEAALVLTYAGGFYHLLRWVTSPPPGRRRHAWAVAAYFVLGFMTKYVATAFLVLVGALAVAWRKQGRPGGREIWRDWWRPTVAAVFAIVPWFAYQFAVHGEMVWQQMFAGQVYQRFTSYLDPNHLEPWYFYFTFAWNGFSASKAAWWVVAGLPVLAWRAWRGNNWTSRLVLLWLIVPVPLISLGTSKLGHYLFPYLPPLALAGGLPVAMAVDAIMAAGSLVAAFDRVRVAGSRWLTTSRRRALSVAGLLAVGLALWTWAAGPVILSAGDVRLLSNSSVLRPLLAGILLMGLAGQFRTVFVAMALAALGAFLPWSAYADNLRQTERLDRPLAAFEACTAARVASGRIVHTGVLVADPHDLTHSYYYYFRHLGGWQTTEATVDHGLAPLVGARLANTDGQTPVLMTHRTWLQLRISSPGAAASSLPDEALDTGLRFEDGHVLLVPPAYEPCLVQAERNGGTVLAQDPEVQ